MEMSKFQESKDTVKRKPFEKHPLTLEEGGYVLDVTTRGRDGFDKVKPATKVKFPTSYIKAVIEQHKAKGDLIEISHDGLTLWHCDSPTAIKHMDPWQPF